MVVIRCRNPRGIDFGYLATMIPGSFMSRVSAVVIPGGELAPERRLTDPDQALDFVARTKVGGFAVAVAVAVAVGSSHGACKLTRLPAGDILAMDVFKAIHERPPTMHMVMHGSSSVPRGLKDIINEHGGEMAQTWGLPVAEIQGDTRHGVGKINLDTDCRMAMTSQFRRRPGRTPPSTTRPSTRPISSSPSRLPEPRRTTDAPDPGEPSLSCPISRSRPSSATA